MSYQTDLSARIGKLHFRNPVMPASGTYDYFENNAGLFPPESLGAIVIKSVHRLPRPGNPPPRIAEVFGGTINAIGIPSIGIEAFMERELPRFESIHAPIVLSISGSRPEHYREILEIVDNDRRISAVEMNLACPNVDNGLTFASDLCVLRHTVEQCRRATNLCLIAKLNPSVPDIRPFVKAAEAAGADAVTLSNTFRAMKIDIEKRRPVLGAAFGGLVGPAVKAPNLFLVWNAYECIDIPIIACGGICSWSDAIEYFLAGASMVQVGSYNFVDPGCMPDIINGIDNYLSACGNSSLCEIVGKAH